MRLVTFLSNGEPHIGAEVAQGVVDFTLAAPQLPESMLDLLADGPKALDEARAAVVRVLSEGGGVIAADQVRLLAPLPRPGKIFGIGLNYRDHARETGNPIPEVPIVFSKAATAVIGPGAAIEIPPASALIDYEGELAVVIGRPAKRVSRRDALHYVAGYTVMNDVTARDYQARSGHCIAKSFDTFAPMGPALVTADDVGDPSMLDLRTIVSGEEMQHARTNKLVFDVPALIEYISAGVTLEPGDVISTGTPAGVGYRRKPRRFLKVGDTVRVEISNIGALENPVISACA
jgi:2-keto-4-pentenoate hydratase/2-oxohepta-3-ene-1,7-dioic acid hydratase in catechol pathway